MVYKENLSPDDKGSDAYFKKPRTLKELDKEIKVVSKNKGVHDKEIHDKLERIKILTEIQVKHLPKKVKDNMKFNIISSFSTTESKIADEISKFILSETDPSLKPDNISELSIIDATACIGGNTLSFAKYFSNVGSIELDKDNFKILEHNIKISQKYKSEFIPELNGEITIHQGNYKDIISNIKHSDIIFFDPPWTKEGIEYNKQNPDIPMLGEETIFKVMDNMCKKYKYVFSKLPPNLS